MSCVPVTRNCEFGVCAASGESKQHSREAARKNRQEIENRGWPMGIIFTSLRHGRRKCARSILPRNFNLELTKLHVNVVIGVTVPHQFDESEGDGPSRCPVKVCGRTWQRKRQSRP